MLHGATEGTGEHYTNPLSWRTLRSPLVYGNGEGKKSKADVGAEQTGKADDDD